MSEPMVSHDTVAFYLLSEEVAKQVKVVQSGQGAEEKDALREAAREEARKKLEAEAGKSNTPPKPLPEFGSAEDFQLAQAINRLKGKPVLVSKTIVERKAEVQAN